MIMADVWLVRVTVTPVNAQQLPQALQPMITATESIAGNVNCSPIFYLPLSLQLPLATLNDDLLYLKQKPN